jgi:membrane dipeptidase
MQMMTRMADDAAEREDFIEAWEAAGVIAVLRNSGEEGNRIDRLIERLAHNTYVTDRMPQFMARAARPADILRAKQEGKRCFYLTTNGVPLHMRQDSVEHDMRHIRILFQLGVRMMHLTYNRRNLIGDGCAEPVDGGLSDFGRAVVREMNRVGVIVDGAHSSLKTCMDMAKISEKPVVVSHSTCMALNTHCRAKTDEVIKAVADTDGFMGICCIPAFLGGSGDISALLDHIDHAVRLVGARHVAIGTDVGARSRAFDAASGDAPATPPGRSAWENFWPVGDALFDERWHDPRMGQSLAWTNFPLFTVGMAQRGYRDEQIAAILGGNVMRVAEAVLAP